MNVQLLDIDRRRQGLREGARALEKQVEAAVCDQPVWVQLPGSASVQLPYGQAALWLSEGEILLPCNLMGMLLLLPSSVQPDIRVSPGLVAVTVFALAGTYTFGASEAKRIEQDASELAQKQKWVVGQITDKNGTPDGCSEEMVRAFLHLKS